MNADLISVRSRGQYNRSFKVVDNIISEADKATAAEVERINAKISEYQTALRKLGESDSGENQQLIDSKIMLERRKIEQDIREANKELRNLQAKRRDKVEKLSFRLQTLNMVVAPSIILIIALGLALIRWHNARIYASRRV